MIQIIISIFTLLSALYQNVSLEHNIIHTIQSRDLTDLNSWIVAFIFTIHYKHLLDEWTTLCNTQDIDRLKHAFLYLINYTDK